MEKVRGPTPDDLETIRSIIKYHLVDRTGAHLEPWFSNEFGDYAEFLKSIRNKLDRIDELTLFDLNTIYAPFTSSIGVDTIGLADPDNPIVRLLIETECLDKVINDIETMVEIANKIRNELWRLTDERRYNILYNQVHELRDNVRLLMSQLNGDIFDVTVRKLVEDSFKLAEIDNDVFYHYGPFHQDINFRERNELFKQVEGEIAELTELIQALEKQLAKQREAEVKSTKQEALIRELQEHIRLLQFVNLAEKVVDKQSIEDMQAQIATLTEKGDDLTRDIKMTMDSNIALARTFDALKLKVDKNFEVTMAVEKYHQECIDEFELIKLSDSRILPNL